MLSYFTKTCGGTNAHGSTCYSKFYNFLVCICVALFMCLFARLLEMFVGCLYNELLCYCRIFVCVNNN